MPLAAVAAAGRPPTGAGGDRQAALEHRVGCPPELAHQRLASWHTHLYMSKIPHRRAPRTRSPRPQADRRRGDHAGRHGTLLHSVVLSREKGVSGRASSGNYSVQLPAGTYDVAVVAPLTHPGNPDQILFVGVGQITVSGSQTVNFTVPTLANLSGTVTHNGAPVPATLFAIDTDDLPGSDDDDIISMSLTGGSATIPLPSTTGSNYKLALPAGATYAVFVDVGLDLGNGMSGDLLLNPLPDCVFMPTPPPSPQTPPPPPCSVLQLTLSTDQTRHFPVPPLPAFIDISGTVTDSTGLPVPGATVSATTSMITNTPGTGFSSLTQADASGVYSLQVLSGPSYTVVGDPPPDPSPQSSALLCKQS